MITRATDTFLPFGAPALSELEAQAAAEAVLSGWVGMGPRVEQFERELCDYLGVEHCVALSSCTAALHLSLLAAGVSHGDEVLVPSLTFAATVRAIELTGARPRLCDVRDDTLTLDPASVRRAVGQDTRAVVTVDYAGGVHDMAELQMITRQLPACTLIEDAAHAFGARSGGSMVGVGLYATCFSFYANKNITCGEGGAIVTDDGRLAQWIRGRRSQGLAQDAWSDLGSERFRGVVTHEGFKYPISDVHAAIGIEQLRRAEELIEARHSQAAVYDQAFADHPVLRPLPRTVPAGDRHGLNMYVVRLDRDAPFERDELLAELRERHIGATVHYLPIHRQPLWRERWPGVERDLPVTEDVMDRVLTLPLSPAFPPDAVERVCDDTLAICEQLSR